MKGITLKPTEELTENAKLKLEIVKLKNQIKLHELKALNIDDVSKRFLFYYLEDENQPKEDYNFTIEAKDYDEAYKKAYDEYGPQVEDMIYKQL